jgi:hypothetical protein
MYPVLKNLHLKTLGTLLASCYWAVSNPFLKTS